MDGPENPNPSATDEALLARAKSGPNGIAEVYDAYADRLFGFLLKRCGHKETAEDLVSRTFMKFIEALPKIEWRGFSLGAWLYRAASNALIDHWRSASVRLDIDVDPESWDLPSQAAHPAVAIDNKMEREKMIGVIKTLSPRDQQVLDLRFFGGCETQEIAAIIGVSPNHAAVLLYRALGHLRIKYSQSYV